MKKVFSYEERWPPLIERGDLAFEIAIVFVALVTAAFAVNGTPRGLLGGVIVLVAMVAMYGWTHATRA